MALIDVSDIVLDPDFTSAMQIIHRTATVNTKGENVITEKLPIQTVGSIQPISGKTLMRVPEALRSENLRSFWTKTPIIADKHGVYTDILVFGCERFQVKHVFDWTNFGAGFTEGLCVAEKPSA